MSFSTISTHALNKAQHSITLIDVREADEFSTASIDGATLIPLAEIPSRLNEIPTDTPVVIMCQTGARSAQAAAFLDRNGYPNIANLDGGIAAWEQAGLAVNAGGGLTARDRERYARHLALPSFGVKGQQLLLDASVIIVGAGGLGSPAALYLAAAGVGRIALCDFDVVERSNLQRQILHDDRSVGTAKSDSGANRLVQLNPDIEVTSINERLTAANANELMSGFDVVVDGTDSFEVRYLINDTAQELGIPVVHGSILRFEGQVTVFPPGGPCYRCLFPHAPPAELSPNCATAGVLGVLPGIVGSMQATEAIKLIVGLPTLAGKLALYDALAQTIDQLKVRKQDGCPACG
jgi:molybdopterin/thiamine biosynthesis adenylyltransferase/rhodanese-related sulfurtransferase